MTGEQKISIIVLGSLTVLVIGFAWQVIAILKQPQPTVIEWVVSNNQAAVSAVPVKPVGKATVAGTSTMSNFELGQYYFNHGDQANGAYDLIKARQYYIEALREDPQGNPLTWYQLGRIDFIEGKFDTALYKFDKQIEYFGDQIPNVYYMIGLTYGYKARRSGEEADWERGAEGFKNYLDYFPQSPWARTDLAWIYFSQGKFADMIPVLEEGLVYEPNQPWLLNMYGLALMNTGKRTTARQQFLLAKEAAAKLTPQDWGKAYPGNNPADWDQGLTEFREAIEKNGALTAV